MNNVVKIETAAPRGDTIAGLFETWLRLELQSREPHLEDADIEDYTAAQSRVEARAATTPATSASEVMLKLAMAVSGESEITTIAKDDPDACNEARLTWSAMRDAYALGLLPVEPAVFGSVPLGGCSAVRESPAIDAGDVELLAWASLFWRDMATCEESRKMFRARQDQVAAMADCPPDTDAEAHKRRQAFMSAHGVEDLCDRVQEDYERAVKAARTVFARPARTVAGVLAKMEITRQVEIEDGQQRGGEDMRGEWIAGDRTMTAAIVDDLQRLAGAVGATTRPASTPQGGAS